MRVIKCDKFHAAYLKHVRYYTKIYEEWESLRWESVMNKVTQEKQPTPSQLELSFRKLAHCRFRPPRDAMHKDLNHLSQLCTTRKAISSWTPRRMVFMFSSCALLEYMHPQLLGDMCKDMREKRVFSELDHIQLVMMVKSMGRLGKTAVKTNSVQPCGVFFGISELLVEVMNEVIQEERGMSFTEVQLCEIWKGLAHLRFYFESFLDPLAKETIKPHRLEYKHRHLKPVASILGYVRHFNEASIVDLFLSAAILTYRRRHFIQAMLNQCMRPYRMKCYKEEDLTRLQCAMHLINKDRALSSSIESASHFETLKEEICKSHRLSAFSGKQLSVIVATWSAMGTVAQKHVDAMAEEIVKDERQKEFRQQKLSYMTSIFIDRQEKGFPSEMPMKPLHELIKNF